MPGAPLKVTLFDPNGQGYAPRIKHEDWEKHRAIISRLHTARTPRKLMIDQLRDDHNFNVTIGQLQAKCKEWNLKCYNVSKEDISVTNSQSNTVPAKTPPATKPTASSRLPQAFGSHAPAFHIAKESGFVEEWADDYRVHPPLPIPTFFIDASSAIAPTFQDRSLPPEYIGGGLLANTADSHWPVPEDEPQCEAMLQAGHYYYAVHAFQQAFSIYRAVYLYQRRHLPLSDPRLITSILRSSCAAVTDHQRNIMHSVLLDVGTSIEIDKLDPLLVESLQAASLNMVSSDITCDIENDEQVRARSAAYLYAINCLDARVTPSNQQTDIQALLYIFEHSLLMQEHTSKPIHSLFQWCELAIDHLQRDLDDIFVGYALSEEDYYRRVAQILSGHLLSQWYRPRQAQTEQLPDFYFPTVADPCAFHFQLTTTQALVALAFMVVDTVRYDPSAVPLAKIADTSARLWFLDAARFFRRGIRVLGQLDDRSRCIAFSAAFLERFYTSVSFRQKAYNRTSQLPAIVDSIGISLAQQGIWTDPELGLDLNQVYSELEMNLGPVPSPEDNVIATRGIVDTSMQDTDGICLEDVPMTNDLTEGVDLLATRAPSSPRSDCSSIASFLNTYHRTLKNRLASNNKSGRSTPGDVISFGSSAEFKFGVVTAINASTDVDSLWQMLTSGDHNSMSA